MNYLNKYALSLAKQIHRDKEKKGKDYHIDNQFWNSVSLIMFLIHLFSCELEKEKPKMLSFILFSV